LHPAGSAHAHHQYAGAGARDFRPARRHLRSQIAFHGTRLGAVIGESLFINHGEAWCERLEPLAPALHPAGLPQFHPLFVQVAGELAAEWEAAAGRPPRDIAPDLAISTARIVMLAVFGLEVTPAAARGFAFYWRRFQYGWHYQPAAPASALSVTMLHALGIFVLLAASMGGHVVAQLCLAMILLLRITALRCHLAVPRKSLPPCRG